MKITVLLLLIPLLHASATGRAQEKFTLNLSQVEVSRVFSNIQKESDYRFFYLREDIKKLGKIDVHVTDATLPEIMNHVLGNALAYKILSDYLVVISPNQTELAEQIDVKGRITDENGEPLPGASIRVKGKNVGVTSETDGTFSIVVDANAVLIITMVGYEAREVSVNGRGQLDNIILSLSTSGLDEVVVVGYGKVQRRNLTASVSSVKSSDVVKSTESSLNAALQGRAAGVDVISSEGGPAPTVSITIRGGSSISASNEPLYVINGFPQLGGSNLDINVNDIESIDIIKDAAAAAYGSRGANGVVLITTKSGKAGKFSINYDAYVNKQSINNQTPVMNAGQYAELQHFLRRGSEYGDTTMFKNWQNYVDSPSIKRLSHNSILPVD